MEIPNVNAHIIDSEKFFYSYVNPGLFSQSFLILFYYRIFFFPVFKHSKFPNV